MSEKEIGKLVVGFMPESSIAALNAVHREIYAFKTQKDEFWSVTEKDNMVVNIDQEVQEMTAIEGLMERILKLPGVNAVFYRDEHPNARHPVRFAGKFEASRKDTQQLVVDYFREQWMKTKRVYDQYCASVGRASEPLLTKQPQQVDDIHSGARHGE